VNNTLCPLCNGKPELLFDGGRDYFVAGGRSADFEVWFCHSCKTGFTMPQMSDRELLEFYPDDYEAYAPKGGFAEYLQRMKYRQDLSMIKRQLDPSSGTTPSLFEIGTGRGEFLDAARKASFDVDGIEQSAKGVEFAEHSYGIKVRTGSASEFVFERKYDVVVLRHVLEHLNSFRECLENIRRNGLKEGGILFIKVPNMDSWEARFFGKYWDGYDLPRHRFHFTKNGLCRVLASTGFDGITAIYEVIPSAAARSISTCARFRKTGPVKYLAALFSTLPLPMQYPILQMCCLTLSCFGTGRLILISKANPLPKTSGGQRND